MLKKRTLVAFDFDHTIIEDNSDYYILKLLPNGEVPPEIKAKYSPDSWTDYMAAIFVCLHQNGITKEAIFKCLSEIPLVKGMRDLLTALDTDLYDVIIISDANSVFIDCILEGFGLRKMIKAVYTNPARWDDKGCLNIEFFHHQDWCQLSTKNLCKGHILDAHIEGARQHHVAYPLVAYVGDGGNDLCPSLRLKAGNLVFPRADFSLVKKIRGLPEGSLKARVEIWTSGQDILDVIQSEVNKSEARI